MEWTRAISTPSENGAVAFTLSTPGEKRDGLTLDQSLFRFENFRRNPVMLWQHGRDPMRGNVPIGRWENVRMEAGVMRADAVFDTEDDFARTIESKYRRGFLNAASIGWMPVWDDRDRITGFDLLEASAVAVPADPDALAEARSADLDFLREAWKRLPEPPPVEHTQDIRRALALEHLRNLRDNLKA